MPEFPQGFVQGRTYLGSFVEGSASDLNPEPGAFAFNISHLSLPPGTQLSVTANYSGTGAATSEPVPLSITRDGDSVTINWSGPGFSLQTALAVTGPWDEELTTGNSFTTPALDRTRFFRLEGSATGGDSSAPMLTSPFSNVVPVF
jgi:hypothetical protein